MELKGTESGEYAQLLNSFGLGSTGLEKPRKTAEAALIDHPPVNRAA
jgi:hypothetical protein